MRVYFWALNSIPLTYTSILLSVSCCPDYCCFVANFEIGECVPQLCSFSRFY